MGKITSIEDGRLAISEMRTKIKIFKDRDWSKETGISKTHMFGNLTSSYVNMALAMGVATDDVLLAGLTVQDEVHVVASLLTEMTDNIEKELNGLINIRDEVLTSLEFNNGKALTRFDIYSIIADAYMKKEKKRAEYLGIDFNHDWFSRRSNIVAVKTTNYFYYNLKDLADAIVFKDFDEFM